MSYVCCSVQRTSDVLSSYLLWAHVLLSQMKIRTVWMHVNFCINSIKNAQHRINVIVRGGRHKHFFLYFIYSPTEQWKMLVALIAKICTICSNLILLLSFPSFIVLEFLSSLCMMIASFISQRGGDGPMKSEPHWSSQHSNLVVRIE